MTDEQQSFFSWSLTVFVPEKLRSSLLNYLNFFRDYARTVSDCSVIVDYAGEETPEGHRLRLAFKTPSAAHAPLARQLLRGYMERVFADAPPVARRDLSRYEADLFLVLYKRALADIRTDLRYYFLLLSDAEKSALATALALLSLADEGREPQKVMEAAAEATLRNIDALSLPSERNELPASLQSPTKADLPETVARRL